MRILIWKMRYTIHMVRRSEFGWSFCWEAAGIALDGTHKAVTEDPRMVVDEQLAYWKTV